VKTIMTGAGPAWMSIGSANGENRSIEAAKSAIHSPMLDVNIEGARGVLLNITGGTNMTLKEVQRAADVIASSVDPDANIIFGMVTDPKMDDEMCVTIIATGLPSIEQMSLNDDGIAEFLRRAISDEADFDLPPFLRPSNRQAS
ncbi:MAG: cell division protein FtsZ, partial [Chloroflexi bacterium]|nr:cell division protein FtsZ [Chloroflexota bacterium]